LIRFPNCREATLVRRPASAWRCWDPGSATQALPASATAFPMAGCSKRRCRCGWHRQPIGPTRRHRRSLHSPPSYTDASVKARSAAPECKQQVSPLLYILDFGGGRPGGH